MPPYRSGWRAASPAGAGRYGLTWESTLTAFVAPQSVISPVFFRQPNIRAELTTAGVPEGDRLDRLSLSLPPPTRQLGRKTSIP
jgi:hypothetical protein